MSPLEKNGQRASELLARFSQPRGLDLDVISQHELLGIRMEVDLLAPLAGDPLGHRVAVVVNPSYKIGHKRQKLTNLTARFLVTGLRSPVTRQLANP